MMAVILTFTKQLTIGKPNFDRKAVKSRHASAARLLMSVSAFPYLICNLRAEKSLDLDFIAFFINIVIEAKF